MHDHNLARAVAMGMRVLFRGPSMSRPTRVADTISSFHRLMADRLFEIPQLAFSAANVEPTLPVIAHGDSRRIVSAVFEPPQSLNNDGNDTFLPDVTDDATHVETSTVF